MIEMFMIFAAELAVGFVIGFIIVSLGSAANKVLMAARPTYLTG